jgi:hypothetical protein
MPRSTAKSSAHASQSSASETRSSHTLLPSPPIFRIATRWRFAWLSRFRRLARDFERYVRTVAAFIHLAMIRIMLRASLQAPHHESKLRGWASNISSGNICIS